MLVSLEKNSVFFSLSGFLIDGVIYKSSVRHQGLGLYVKFSTKDLCKPIHMKIVN